MNIINFSLKNILVRILNFNQVNPRKYIKFNPENNLDENNFPTTISNTFYLPLNFFFKLYVETKKGNYHLHFFQILTILI